MSEPRNEPNRESPAARIGSAVIGVLFIAAAILILLDATPFTSIWQPIAALVIGALGVDGVVSALRSKRSILSRIGPLP